MKKNNLKNERGVTITSVLIYIIALTAVVIIIGRISTYFYRNMDQVTTNTAAAAEYTKFNSYFTDEINIEGNEVEFWEPNLIIFSKSENQYTFQGKGIYRNKVKICKDIDACTFSYNEDTKKIDVYLKIYNRDYNVTYTVAKDVTVSSGSGSGSGSVGETLTVGKKYEEETDITVDGTPVTVPGGATISGIEEETTIDKGLVIYIIPEGEPEITDWKADSDNNGIIDVQEKYDQFIWVPVPNAVLDLSSDSTTLSSETDIKASVQNEINAGRYPMAIKNTDGNYFGVLYDFNFDSTTNKVKVEPYGSWTPILKSSYREPSALDSWDKTYLPQVNGILNTNYTDTTLFENELQNEFNNMVTSVLTNKGFWVGRYETSKMSNSTTETYTSSNEIKINVVKGATTGVNSVTWYRMYAQQKLYSSKTNITLASSMIWGSQWDQIMIWMKSEPNETSYAGDKPFYIINAQGMGNFAASAGGTGRKADTGYYAVKNIYDLTGNVYDWTLETGITNCRVHRGGFYYDTHSDYTKSAYRGDNDPNNISNEFYGSRATLY